MISRGGGGMSGTRAAWLVAQREVRERGRSRALWVSVLVMIIAVAGMIIVPSVLTRGSGSRDVGLAGSVPAGLPAAIGSQASAVSITAKMHSYPSVAAGEAAVRRSEITVLIVDATRLEWRRQPEAQLRAALTAAIQLTAVSDRAVTAGITPRALAGLLAPVPVSNIQLGSVTGRTPGDEMIALVMTVLLLVAISTYGGLVLTGVVEEKTSRVVEVLLAHVPARSLLAGKITGIGLLGLAQIGVTAIAALVATAFVRSVDIPAIRGSVLAWAVVWFVLGYALYAMLYGSLGALASRSEDAQSAAGPVTAVLIASYFGSFLAVGRPDSDLARAVSFFPMTAPMAMPNRIAMGATAWWEPVTAAAVTIAAIAVLVRFAGRVYTRAILHGGSALKLRDAWRGAPAAHGGAREGEHSRQLAIVALLAAGVGLGAGVAILAHDVIIGVAAGAGFCAVTNRLLKAWPSHRARH